MSRYDVSYLYENVLRLVCEIEKEEAVVVFVSGNPNITGTVR